MRIHKQVYNRYTSPALDAITVEFTDGDLLWLKYGGVCVGRPAWKLKRIKRRAEARINAAYENALAVGAMHSARY